MSTIYFSKLIAVCRIARLFHHENFVKTLENFKENKFALYNLFQLIAQRLAKTTPPQCPDSQEGL